MLLSCIASCSTALWSLLRRADSRFHLFIFSHDRFILHCNLHKKRHPSLLPSLCSPPTHIYRHAATDELNLDSAVVKLCLIMLLLFFVAVALIQLFSSISFSCFSAPRNSSPAVISSLCLLGRLGRGGEGEVGRGIRRARFPSTDLKRVKSIFRGNLWSSTESLSGKLPYGSAAEPHAGLLSLERVPDRWITVTAL